MNKILGIITAILLIAMTSCNKAANNANEACKAAEKGDVVLAQEYADKAYESFDMLDVDAMCRLAASYAVITLTTGDQQAAERFQKCYKASMNTNPKQAEEVYKKLDPQMADGLAIISGLLDGRENFVDKSQPAGNPSDSSSEEMIQKEMISTEAMAED